MKNRHIDADKSRILAVKKSKVKFRKSKLIVENILQNIKPKMKGMRQMKKSTQSERQYHRGKREKLRQSRLL